MDEKWEEIDLPILPGLRDPAYRLFDRECEWSPEFQKIVGWFLQETRRRRIEMSKRVIQEEISEWACDWCKKKIEVEWPITFRCYQFGDEVDYSTFCNIEHLVKYLQKEVHKYDSAECRTHIDMDGEELQELVEGLK